MFGKLTHNGPTQQELVVRDARKALDKDDQRRAPQEHQDRVKTIREREYGKQTTEWTDKDGKSGTWGGSSDNLRKVI